ncbi:MAG: Negative regulator of beta-lactamase expression, partial [uncultured Gemmatimonadetes bacterium]
EENCAHRACGGAPGAGRLPGRGGRRPPRGGGGDGQRDRGPGEGAGAQGVRYGRGWAGGDRLPGGQRARHLRRRHRPGAGGGHRRHAAGGPPAAGAPRAVAALQRRFHLERHQGGDRGARGVLAHQPVGGAHADREAGARNQLRAVQRAVPSHRRLLRERVQLLQRLLQRGVRDLHRQRQRQQAAHHARVWARAGLPARAEAVRPRQLHPDDRRQPVPGPVRHGVRMGGAGRVRSRFHHALQLAGVRPAPLHGPERRRGVRILVPYGPFRRRRGRLAEAVPRRLHHRGQQQREQRRLRGQVRGLGQLERGDERRLLRHRLQLRGHAGDLGPGDLLVLPAVRGHEDDRRVVGGRDQPLHHGPVHRVQRVGRRGGPCGGEPAGQRGQVGGAGYVELLGGVEQGAALALDHHRLRGDRRRHPRAV